MHTLAAAQQVAVTASSSVPRSSSSSSLLRKSVTSSWILSAISSPIFRESNFEAKPSSFPSGTSSAPAIPVFDTGLRIRNACLVSSSPRRSTITISEGNVVRSFASRKDRREIGTGETKKFEPDIAALKTGFSKKFPGEDASAFRYNWDSEDEDNDDDEVQVKSFRSGNYDRARFAKEVYSSRTDSFSSRGRLETGTNADVAFERRTTQGNIRTSRGSSRESTRDHRPEGITKDYRSPRGTASSLKERGVRNFSSSGQMRLNYTSRNFRDGGRNETVRGSVVSSKSSVVDGLVRRGREPYGGGEWSKDTPVFDKDEEKKNKKPVIEPVNFTSAMSKDPHVAILGGGMSGLVCALRLEEHGIQSTVFDTGKHGLGGRMGTRYVDEHNGTRLAFDHAAQFFTVTDPRFQKLVDRWISEGAVKEWSGNVGTLQAGGHFDELPHIIRYIGTNGMRSLADHMLCQSQRINVKRPCWISSMEAVNGCWKLTENKKQQGVFDAVVIAHNGKCANRLLSSANVPRIARQMKNLELSSIWALLAAFEEPLPLPGSQHLDGAFVDGIDSLSWMGNNSSKLVLPGDRTPQCWTFFSTAAYGKKHKVPQESIPIAKAQRVKSDILHGVEAALGLSEDSLPTPFYTHLQLWGAALPTNTPGVPCIFDSCGRVGICGDWLVGASLEAAALSGMALADHIAKYRDHAEEDGEEFSIGLQHSFGTVTCHDIGQFPGVKESQKQSHQEALAIS